MRKRANPRRLFAPISRNLCNYPIARDPHVSASWTKSLKTGRWLSDLTGDVRVQFRLPPDTAERSRRQPTAFDLNVLYALLAEVRRRKLDRIEFPSISAVLQLIGYSAEARNRRKCRDALVLWSKLLMRFQGWYVPERYGYEDADGKRHSRYVRGTRKQTSDSLEDRARRQKMVLLPPIEKLRADGHRILITISSDWLEIADRYYVRAPIPLPRDAATQNLVLLLLTSRSWIGEFNEKQTHPRRVIELCRKIGVDHNNRSARLRHAIENAQRWFSQNGGELAHYWPTGSNVVRFIIMKDPQPTRSHTVAQNVDPDLHAEKRAMIEFEAKMAARSVSFDDAGDARAAFDADQRRREKERLGQ